MGRCVPDSTVHLLGDAGSWTGDSQRAPDVGTRALHLALQVLTALTELKKIDQAAWASALQSAFNFASVHSRQPLIVRFGALHLLAALGRGRSNLMPPLALEDIYSCLAFCINDPAAPVRHAAVGACAAWISSSLGDSASDISELADEALAVALQCGEDLHDDSLVADSIELLITNCKCKSSPSLILSRLLTVFASTVLAKSTSPASGSRALAAAVALVRHHFLCRSPAETGCSHYDVDPLIEQLSEPVMQVFQSQALLLQYHTEVLDGFELCCSYRPPCSNVAPGLFSRFFHLLCGGVSPDWPAYDDDAFNGVALANPCRYAAGFCALLAHGQSNGHSPLWVQSNRLGLPHSSMAVCVIRRLLGVSPGTWLIDPCCDPCLPQAPTGSTTPEGHAAAAMIAKCLFSLIDASTAAQCGPPILDAVLEAANTSKVSTPALLQTCAVVLRTSGLVVFGQHVEYKLQAVCQLLCIAGSNQECSTSLAEMLDILAELISLTDIQSGKPSCTSCELDGMNMKETYTLTTMRQHVSDAATSVARCVSINLAAQERRLRKRKRATMDVDDVVSSADVETCQLASGRDRELIQGAAKLLERLQAVGGFSGAADKVGQYLELMPAVEAEAFLLQLQALANQRVS